MINKERIAVVLLGLPASGKGTQAEILAKKINATIIGIGDLVREAIKNGDPKNELIKKILLNYNNGIPQSDEIVRELLENKLSNTNGNVIFDNYPFSKKQIEDFEEIINKYNFTSVKIIHIKIDPNSSIKRISTRLVCDKCKKVYFTGNPGDKCQSYGCSGKLTKRSDDSSEIMMHRIKFAQPRIQLVINHFNNFNNVYEIDGEKSIPDVEKSIENVL